MSRINNKKNSTPVKAFCKVCHDAGKSESEYTSHFVKSTTGIVICPTLLEQKCRFCGLMGHTVKFCTVLAQRKKNEEKLQPQMNKKPEPPIVKKKIMSNAFSALDDDPNDTVVEAKKEEYPALNLPALNVKPTTSAKTNGAAMPFSYASMAAKPIEQEELFRIQSKKVPISKAIQVKIKSKRWADWSDSEEEYDDVLCCGNSSDEE